MVETQKLGKFEDMTEKLKKELEAHKIGWFLKWKILGISKKLDKLMKIEEL
ncbi:MAG: hypothetical protein ACFFCS_19240 [Candidatus Hodarchaeota archaeon]